MSVDVLAFGAHPDDVEIGMGGTLALCARRGLVTAICDLTRAELSSNGTVETRQAEAEEAARVLGVAVRENAGLADRGFRVNEETVATVTAIIRRLKPQVVFAPYEEDRHPDHRLCSQLVQEAVANAALRRYAPSGCPKEPHRVAALYFYLIHGNTKPSFVVDISETQSLKETALLAYRSQFVAAPERVATPLNQGFLDALRARDRWFGHVAGVTYGEGFVSAVPVVVDVGAWKRSR